MNCGLSNHLPHKCLKVTNKQERKTVFKIKNLCYICLEPGHIPNVCSSDYVCKKCDKKHHVSIFSYDPRSPLNSQQTHQNDLTLNNFSSNQNNQGSNLLEITFCCKLHMSRLQI